MPRTTHPPTRAEKRHVFLFLVATAARPAHGEDCDDRNRPPMYLHRAFLSSEWNAVADRLDVRRALGRTAGRTLGRSGFVATLRAISDDARSLRDLERERYRDKARRDAEAAKADHERAVAAIYEMAEETRRKVDFVRVTELDKELDRLLALYARRANTVFRPTQLDNECAVAHREPQGVNVIRLRRDIDDGADEEFERLADAYSDDDDDPAEWDDMVDEARGLGFDCSSPVPASAVHRVEARDDDADDEADDAPVATVRALRPASTP